MGRGYVQEFRQPDQGYYPGLGEAVSAAEELSPDTVYITDSVRQPYIFALFYTTPPPERFLESAEYGTDLDGVMRTVERFEGFEFADPEKADLLILNLEDAEEQGKEILERHGIYAVCR